MKSELSYVIHASNVQGLGAIQVVQSIINAIQRIDPSHQYVCYGPQKLLDSLQHNSVNFDFRLYRRNMPNAVSRFCESSLSPLFFDRAQGFIVLGDVPLRIKARQTVLVHQANLLSPSLNPFSNRSPKYYLLRKVFASNIKYATHFIVQTGAMADAMVQSYPAMLGKVSVVPQPPPSWFDGAHIKNSRGLTPTRRLKLFYPAAYYPHKNHQIFSRMVRYQKRLEEVLEGIILTVTKEQVGFEAHWIQTLGTITPSEVIEYYQKSDALIFPSLLESYGLPLVEAMVAGLPILCSDLPYARWLCEDQAIYFDPLNPDSVIDAIVELRDRLLSGWLPKWSDALQKLPNSWDEVAEHFLDSLK